MNKQELRKIYLEKRRYVPEIQKNDWDKKVRTKLKPFISKYQNIALFYPKKTEIDLLPLIKEYPQKNFLLPKTTEEQSLNFYSTTEPLLTHKAFAIKEPQGIKAITPDLIICPLICFDQQKQRIGYGKGYYDRSLAKLNCPTIGVAYDLQFSKIAIPAEQYDIALHYIITESKIFTD